MYFANFFILQFSCREKKIVNFFGDFFVRDKREYQI